MPSYRAPVDDVMFLLQDVVGFDRHGNLPGFADLGTDTLDAILREGAKLVEEVVQPLNRTGDLEGCIREPDGSVKAPSGFREAYRAYSEGGWIGLSA
ncbi:acyl-CoA dehydrogenase N-terminal domain-containing protein, partial [Cylindrospermopsis raciborskii CS-506_A]